MWALNMLVFRYDLPKGYYNETAIKAYRYADAIISMSGSQGGGGSGGDFTDLLAELQAQNPIPTNNTFLYYNDGKFSWKTYIDPNELLEEFLKEFLTSVNNQVPQPVPTEE